MLTSATEADFTAFKTTYGFTVESDAGPLLARSFLFLKTLPWCDADQDNTPEIVEAQLFIAFAMSEEGGLFAFASVVQKQSIKREKVDVIEQEFFETPSMSGNDPFTRLKTLTEAYGILSPYLCATPALTADTHQASVYVV